MAIRKLLLVFFSLTSISSVSVTSLSNLTGQLARLSLEPPLAIFEISRQESELNKKISSCNVEAAVEEIEIKLFEMLSSGISQNDAAFIIGSLFIDAKELVVAAVKRKSFTLLRLLQIVYIWRDEAQFHWFKAQSYHSPWYDGKLWKSSKPFPMNWKRNYRAICKVDNGVLAAAIHKKISSRSALRIFFAKLLKLCAKYDSIKVFEAIKMDPVILKRYLKLLSINSSVKLLRLYQARENLKNLHLENFPFPERLAANADDFKFLQSHGHDCFPMNHFIKKFCEEGRLDLLEYLYKLDDGLGPNYWDLELAAEKGYIEILLWANRIFQVNEPYAVRLVAVLAVNQHLQALDLWLNVNNMTFDEKIIGVIVDAGALEALLWIDKRQKIDQFRQEWSDSAAKKCHLPVLKWIHSRFKLFPSIEALEHASTGPLRRLIRSIDKALSTKDLMRFEMDNSEFLQWIYENAPPLLFADYKRALSKNIYTKEAMEWLYEKLKICPSSMNWAYEIGDLGAIKWILKNCQIAPTSENIFYAAGKGHFHIIEWAYTIYPESLQMPETLRAAIESGNLIIAEYLMSKFIPRGELYVQIYCNDCPDDHLSILEWVHGHGFTFDPSYELTWAAQRGDLQVIEWLFKNFSLDLADSALWYNLALFDHHEIYRWLLEKYPEKRQRDELWEDFDAAYYSGNLKVVEMLLKKNPTLARKIPKITITSLNYHLKPWLIAKGCIRDNN